MAETLPRPQEALAASRAAAPGGSTLLARYLQKCEDAGSPAVAVPVHEAIGASCIAFNRPAFARDFPLAWEGFGGDARRAEQWLVGEAAFLAAGQFRQAQQVCVARHPPGPARTRPVLRQARMGRTSVAECGLEAQEILLEMKGCGVWPGAVPTTEPYGNGLLALECGAKEYLLGVVLPQVVPAGQSWRFANVYGLILLDVLMQRGEGWHPAVILVREASVRDPVSDLPLAGSPEWSVTVEVELVLRRCGFTSCFEEPLLIERDACGNLATSKVIGEEPDADARVLTAILDQGRDPGRYPLDVINVQINRPVPDANENLVVDLEHFKFVGSRRDLDLMTLCREPEMAFGGIVPRCRLPPCELPLAAAHGMHLDWRRSPCDAALHPYLDKAGTSGAARYKQEMMKAYLASLSLRSPSILRESLRRIERRWLATLCPSRAACTAR